MVMQLIAAMSATEKALDDQIMKLTYFCQQIDKTIQQVDEVLGGSIKGYDQQMNSKLSGTKNQLETTIAQLKAAKLSVQTVRTI